MMIDQMMELHPAVQYFHIGADEVNYKQTYGPCCDKTFSLFLTKYESNQSPKLQRLTRKLKFRL